METEDHPELETTISDIPEEILEYILSLLSPYNDLKSAMQVCRLWNKCVPVVVRKLQSDFHSTVASGGLHWHQHPAESGPTITERYSHSACYHGNSLYVFGGCTSTNTAFNDLWRFDLDNQQWVRPLASGTYPSPKACASMVTYKDRLLLFGGWSQPTPYPLHQAAKFFGELHIYIPATNRWSQVVNSVAPPGKAGHGASIVGSSMVMFGGFHGHGSCNDVWVLDLTNLEDMTWSKKEIPTKKPLARYGHSQVVLDDSHMLVIGGCGGPNMQFSDIWLLDMETPQWKWHLVKVQGSEFAAPQLWCHPACKVDNKVVVLSKNSKSTWSQPTADKSQNASANNMRRVWVPPTQNGSAAPGHGTRSKGQRGHHKRPPPETSESSSQESSSDTEDCCPRRIVPHHRRSPGLSPSKQSAGSRAAGLPPPVLDPSNSQTTSPRSGMPSVRPNAMRDRQRQLETLRRYEEKFRQRNSQSKSPPEDALASSIQRALNPMCIHILDTSAVVARNTATWLPSLEQDLDNAPEERIFYSLTQGRAELIVFGGLQSDMKTMAIQSNTRASSVAVTRDVHFIRAGRTLR